MNIYFIIIHNIFRQSLGSKMRKVQILTLINFVLYIIVKKFIRNIAFALLLVFTMAIFYIWIYISLTKSIKELKKG